MRVCIHRGTHEIGGTCIEIESQGKQIVLDIGLPLDSDIQDVPLPPVKGFDRPDESLLGVVISHPHQDHYGLAGKLPVNTPIFIGAAAERILKASIFFTRSGAAFQNVTHLEHRKPLQVGPFRITPYLVDHSAYDAYAVLVEADGKKLFYSGDLRAHGNKGKLFEDLVRRPPRNVDVLLMEGTTLGRQDGELACPEASLVPRFVDLFKDTKGLALVCCSGQNIDRLVTVFKAARRAGRVFIMDGYTAHILRSTENPRLPQSHWEGIRVFWPLNLRIKIKETRRFDLIDDLPGRRIFPEEIATIAGSAVMLFRPVMGRDLGGKYSDCLKGAGLTYSLWPGYLDRPDGLKLQAWLKRHDIPLHMCHTSGHASPADLKRLAKNVAPGMLVPVHGTHPERVGQLFDQVRIVEDHQWWLL